MIRAHTGKAAAIFAATFAVVVACGGPEREPPAAPTVTESVAERCPDLAKADEVAAFDFQKEYVLSRAAADKLKAAALAANEIQQLSEKLDADLGIACSDLAHDLGDRSELHTGNEACAAAVKDLADARGKLGSKAALALVVRPPLCLSDASLMTKCASICDSSVPAERIDAECEKKAGQCNGDCDGVCEAKGNVKCAGTCTGTCDGAVKGTCGGRCKGTCDGRFVNGPCAGTCSGSCGGGPMSGECKGTCAGACALATPGICNGTCTGKCSVDLDDVKCAGGYHTPDVSTDCRARCDLAAINHTECSKPAVGLVITGASGAGSRDAADALRGAVDKSFPALLKTLIEVGDDGGKRIATARAVIESARAGFKEMALSGGKATADAAQTQLAKCFDSAFKGAAAAAATAKTGVDEAVAVRDAVSK